MRYAMIAVLVLTAGAAFGQTPGADWAGAGAVTFYADFDEGPYACRSDGSPYQVGTGFEFVANGRWGSAWTNTSKMGFIGFDGTDNVPLQAGTVSMWVKSGASNIFADGKTHCLASLPRTLEGLFATPKLQSTHGLTLSVRKTEANTLDLIAHIGEGHYIWPMDTETLASLDVSALDGSAWRHVIFSWDFATRKVWLALDGEVAEGVIPAAITQPHEYLCAIFGNTQSYLASHQEPLDGLLDEIAILNVPYEQALAVMADDTPLTIARPPDPTWVSQPTLFADDENLSRIEAIARQHLDMLVATQKFGGWSLGFRWPSMLQYTAKTRMPEPMNKIWLSKDGQTAFGGMLLTYGYECIGDERYLQAARNTADMYLAAQNPDGYWAHGYFFEDGSYLPATDIALIQDHVQTGPLMLLSYASRVTGEEKYLDAARRNADFLARIQNPNGSWSHHYDPEQGAGVTSTGVVGGGEVNDYGTSGPIATLLEFAKFTGDDTYRDAALKGADWLIEAFIDTGKLAGWAGQYNDQNQPEAARHHEPAAVTQYGARWAANGLIAAYRATLDGKYLAPLDRVLEWFDANKLDGGWWWDYDVATGRPVRMWRRQIYFLDDPKQVAAYMQATGYTSPPKPSDAVNVEQLRNEVKNARERPEGKTYELTDRAGLERWLASNAPHYVDYYIGSTTQPFNERAGLFTWEAEAGEATSLVRHQIVRFCNIMMRARAVKGEVPVDHPYFTQLDAFVGWNKVHACPGPDAAD
jgi:rhamnogalacturonyl hydrolase YesR